MKPLYALLLTLSLSASTAYASLPTQKHTIKKGDSLSTIALKYNTTVAKVRQANGLQKNGVIKIGKVLEIPTNSHAEASAKSENYVIKKGDTLSTIAQKHHTTTAKLREANGLAKNAILKTGKVLKVPHNGQNNGQKVILAKSENYVIKKGDTLSTIAQKHHTTTAKLREANGLAKNAILKTGKVLKVPHNGKKVILAKTKKKVSSKKFVSNLSKLDTISIKKKKEEKSKTFAFTDLFTSSNKNKEESDKCKRIISLAKEKLGKKYVWGASGNKNTYDCSSFVKFVYKKNGVELPRTSIMQSKVGKYVKRDELQEGDLIFFDTSKKRKGYVNHVGIYLGDGKFIHASSAKKKVVITSLDKAFYSNRYKGARRPS